MAPGLLFPSLPAPPAAGSALPDPTRKETKNS
jgi:hypothetical protein